MNLRILKKLSKRAAPLLRQLGDGRDQFPAKKGENYIGTVITVRKHFDRGRSVHGEVWDDREIKTPAKDGRGWVYQRPPSEPRKGTIMVGAVTGYYEPEWIEDSAWKELAVLVIAHHTDWGAEVPREMRRFRTPSDILRAAEEMIREEIDGRLSQ